MLLTAATQGYNDLSYLVPDKDVIDLPCGSSTSGDSLLVSILSFSSGLCSLTSQASKGFSFLLLGLYGWGIHSV